MMTMPGHSYKGPLPPLTAGEERLAGLLRGHVEVLAGSIGDRHVWRPRSLDAAMQYIIDQLRSSGLAVRELPYLVEGRTVSNIEVELKGARAPDEIVVVGAHYDTVPGTPGADDNASGVAALIELASQFKGVSPGRTVRFVAFVNEEPPFFQTSLMGSRVYAAQARQQGEKIVAMLSLETIGYYADRPGSQDYPSPFNLLYPDTGNFIGFVANLGSRSLLRRCIGTFRDTTPFPSEGLAAPPFISGIGWSDHWSFWQEGYPALMLTDTAPYRYPHYHGPGDTPDQLDYQRMARVVAGIGRMVEDLAR